MVNLELVEEFFKMNLAVKNIIVRLTLKEEDGYDLESCMNYVEKLEIGLKTILRLLERMANILGLGEDVLKHISSQISTMLAKILQVNYDFYKISSLYNEFVQNMNETLVKNLNENVKGYSILNNPGKIFGEAKSINEMLHILHHCMINNEVIYEKVPVIAKKDDGRNIILRGKDTPSAREIFTNIDNHIDASIVDILAVNEDKILIMARDLGHALTMELEIEENKVLVRYFIPKICNYIMVNQLPGVRPVNMESKNTTGEFLIDRDGLSDAINSFMLMVPNDKHMFTYGGLFYNDLEKTSAMR